MSSTQEKIQDLERKIDRYKRGVQVIEQKLSQDPDPARKEQLLHHLKILEERHHIDTTWVDILSDQLESQQGSP
jgi:hypothetical protein